MLDAVTWTPGPTKLRGVVWAHPWARMLFTRLASALTGQNHDGQAVWWIVAPCCPFFWLSSHKVTEAVCESCRGATVLGMILPAASRNVTSCVRN
jgi:hypothetical protein